MALGGEHAFVGFIGLCELSGERSALERALGEYAPSPLRKCTGLWRGRFFCVSDSGEGYLGDLYSGEFAGGDGIFSVAESTL